MQNDDGTVIIIITPPPTGAAMAMDVSSPSGTSSSRIAEILRKAADSLDTPT